MTMLTRDPKPPFVAVEICLGHAFGYATCWEVVDDNNAYPLQDALERDPGTLMDREWCEREADRLNAKYASGMEAATAGETTKIGSTVGDSPTAESGDAQGAQPYVR